MHVAGDLGFSSLVLVFCFLFPVIGFLIRRKWSQSVSRQVEVKRLLILAIEEARRAEEEAFYGYGFSQISTAYNQCAICFSSTTTRCARCKAVRYCSAKCQIVHWRQGHKEECSPPLDNEQNDTHKKVTVQQHEIDGEKIAIERRDENKSVEESYRAPGFDNSNCYPEVSKSKDEDLKARLDTKETDISVSYSSSISFSGFSATSSRNDLSDDVSVSESTSSCETEGSNGYVSADNDSDMLDKTSHESKVDDTKPLRFASLFDSVDSFSELCRLDDNKIKCSNGDDKQFSNWSSVSSQTGMPENSNGNLFTASTGFWGNTLEPNHSPSYIDTDNAQSSSSRSYQGILPNSKFSVLLPSAKLNEKYADKAATSSEVSSEAQKGWTSLSSKCGRSTKNEDNDSSCHSYASNSVENDSVSLPRLHNHQSSSACGDSSKKDPSKVDSLQFSGSKKTDLLSEANFASTHGHSIRSLKSGNESGAQTVINVPNSKIGLKNSMPKVADQMRGSIVSKHDSVGNRNDGTRRYNNMGVFSYESFVKLYTWNKVELRPSGLLNCGNSCYANAVLQCLAFTPPLTAYFIQGFHSQACVKREWCFACEFESLIQKVKGGQSPLSPKDILSKLQNTGSQLGNGREEDAHEFLRYAIDTMQSVCRSEAKVNVSGSLEEETTLIGLTFGGYLRSKIKCAKCQGKSERQERMMDLTVEIEGDIGTLEEALKQFTATEILDGNNKYQCSRCKSYEKAKKKLTILEAPNVLTIALKRFQSGKFGKLNKAICFPEILDLAPYMSGTSDKSPIYRLYGVIVHLDVMNAAFSGHYVCYTKNVQNKWFKIDDSTVIPIELERVLSKGAYMLLYARCSPRAPRVIRNRAINSDAKIKPAPKSTRDNPTNVESFYNKFYRIRKILEEDSSSDSYSFTSSNSDEGSCSTDSTRDSRSTDDLSDFIFGDTVGPGWSNRVTSNSDSDTWSWPSSSPSYLRNSPAADSKDNKGSFDSTKQCRKSALSSSNTGSSSFRETDMGRLGFNNNGKAGVFCRERIN